MTSNPTLRWGASGPEVAALQLLLNVASAKGTTPRNADPAQLVDGYFGDETLAAVRAFQTASGLSADGVVGSGTWGALAFASPPPLPALPPMSVAAAATFSKVLGIREASNGEDLLAALACVLQAPRSTVATPLVPGDLASIAAVFSQMLSAASSGTALYDRLAALQWFYETQAAAASPLNAMRLWVISLAMSQIGTVKAKSTNPNDGTSRIGWARLNEYLLESYGNVYSYGMTNAKTRENDLIAWCGIFALWANKAAGLVPSGFWVTGYTIWKVEGIDSVDKANVMPGDIGVLPDGTGHHFIVAAVDGDSLITVEGNANTNGAIHTIADDLNDGQIVRKNNRTISGTYEFYRAQGIDG